MILHIDMDAFYAAVELRDQPGLRGQPVVVGGSPQGRGVISAASYEARRYGVRSAMSAAQAQRLCSKLVFIKPRMDHYAAVSRQIREIFFRFTSLVEPLALDEAFLDVGGSQRLFGDAQQIGQAIKRAILDELQLVASVGVAPNKFLAKLASDLEKPDGFVVVPTDSIQAFLDPLEITRVWGVGPQTARRFESQGVTTIGQLRTLSAERLTSLFGKQAGHFWRLSRGLDQRPVVPDRIAKSISHETTFAEDIHDVEELQAWLLELSDQVGRRLRRHEIQGKTVQLKLRYHDFRTITRSRTLDRPTQGTDEIYRNASQLMQTAIQEHDESVRLIGVGLAGLTGGQSQQQYLFEHPGTEKAGHVDRAADGRRRLDVRQRDSQ